MWTRGLLSYFAMYEDWRCELSMKKIDACCKVSDGLCGIGLLVLIYMPYCCRVIMSMLDILEGDRMGQ